MSNWQNGYGTSRTQTQQGSGQDLRKPDPRQIAFISNNRNCMAAVDCLKVADLADNKEKSPSAIHSRYSRIRISITDFSQNPTLYHTFYLTPSEVRRLYRRVATHYGVRSFAYKRFKEKNKGGKKISEVFRLDKDPYYRNKSTQEIVVKDGQKVLADYPWKLTISKGESGAGANDKSFKSPFKLFGDDELEDFFCTLVSFLDVWEMTYGPQHLIDISEIPSYHDLQDISEEEDGDDEPYL